LFNLNRNIDGAALDVQTALTVTPTDAWDFRAYYSQMRQAERSAKRVATC
jgi:hypothetical protein